MSESVIFDAIITGAGPAGLFCAINCCLNKDCRILVLEKMNSAGRKLLLSGSGSCNITHSGKIMDFQNRYGENGRFLRHAFSGFDNNSMIDYLNSNGIATIENENGKIFPESMKAREILDLLLHKCTESGVEILYNTKVQKIECIDGKFRVRASGQFFESRCCVITTGGLSYPATGSSGDGFKLAESLGHSITDITAALTPVNAIPAPDALTPGKKIPLELSGLTLQNSTIALYRNNQKIKTCSGDLLFTHTGLSGPVILDMSRYIEPGDIITVSFIHDNPESFENRFNMNSRTDGKRNIKNFLHTFLIPDRIIQTFLDISAISYNKKTSQISREERKQLIALSTAFPFKVISKGDYNIAMATHGGVSLKEINMHTMESKLVPGLFFAGEVMDIDGDTGGYNLQAAFSTGKLAGDNIYKRFCKTGSEHN